MVGDALGDMQAAKDTGVLFYPILPGQEEESWKVFSEEILPDFLAGRYRGKGMEGWQKKCWSFYSDRILKLIDEGLSLPVK